MAAPRLSDDPALDDLRLKLAMHQRFACPVEGNGCEVCLSLWSEEEAWLELHLPRFHPVSVSDAA
jgi:hypothetical protein